MLLFLPVDLEEAEDAKMQLGILDIWVERVSEAMANIVARR